MTPEQLRTLVEVDEPRYEAVARRVTVADVPALTELMATGDLNLASKAASLAAYLDADAARPLLQAATGHDHAVVRASAAAALRTHPDLSAEFAAELLADADVGVRGWTLKALDATRPAGVRALVAGHAKREQVMSLRRAADDLAAHLP